MTITPKKLALYLGFATLSGAMTACGGDNNSSDNNSSDNTSVTTQVAPLTCDDTMKTKFMPDANTSVLLVKAFKAGEPLLLTGTANANTPVATKDVCVVKLNVGPGNAGPADAPSTSTGIGMEIWLPTAANWNGRVHLKGNGGWAGGVQGSTTALAGIASDTAGTVSTTAMQEGAVSGSTDTGHANTANAGSFAMNPDGTINQALWKDFSERSIHELAVKTKALALAYYGRAAAHTYWNGFSTGGRQGMKAAQALPTDFDGILAGAPAINWTLFSTGHMFPQIVMERDLTGVRPTAGQESLVSNAAISACDMVGGKHLGYVPDPATCTYDPSLDPTVLCTANGGTNTTANCVTPAQANAFNKIWYGFTADGTIPMPSADNGAAVTLASGQRWFGPTRGSSLANFLGGPLANSSSQVALELQDPSYGLPLFVNATGNGTNLWKTFTYAQLSNAADRGLALQQNFSSIDTDNPDLSAYRDHGGKLIMYHGLADSLIKTGGSVNYYNRVLAKMGGTASVQNFYRLYLIPGMFHGLSNGSANPNANPPLPTNAQLYDALTNWVEKGIAPGRIDIATAVTATFPTQKSYPLCVYPMKAAFVAGDPILTTSYTCQ
nr:tannase/feruloyl esterase family alpha/beta hydrolase [uncultured Cupriavidus sp.]